MNFELITGGAGSGKSECLEMKIKECLENGKRAVVIVPERFSHIEERTLCERFGGLGLNGIEVTSFSKLSRRLAPRGEYLKPSGRQMLILKAALANADAGDGVFEGACARSGFIERISETISELKRSMVTPQMLSAYSGGGLLERKLKALSHIYGGYNKLIENRFADPDEDMSALAELIDSEGGFGDAWVFIDGFSDFMPSHYQVIEALIKRADCVFITLTINDSGLRSPDGVFAPAAICREKLLEIANDCGAVCTQRHLPGEYGYIEAEDIRYFLANYDEYEPELRCPECNNISVSGHFNRYREVEWLAGRIMNEVRENKLRFRDIGVLVGNLDAYAHIIDAVFAEYGIPYFADRKIPASEHPVIRLILSVFRIVAENWSFASVFEYLRSGFIYRKTEKGVRAIEAHEIDRLELYAKSRGIRGKKVWLSEDAWKPLKAGIFDEATGSSVHEEDITGIDKLRRELMLPFVKLMEKIRGRQKVLNLASALFEFLNDINLYEGLLLEQKRFEERNMLDDAARLGEIWGILLETLDQCVLTSGEEYMSREDFLLLLESGFSQCAVDAVPAGADRVSVGTADKSRPVRVKSLFVVGAVRGEMPCEQSDGGIINNSDRALLAAEGSVILPDKQTKTALAEYNLYSSLTAACERIYVSYPEMSEEGAKTAPCALVGEILRCFDTLAVAHTSADEEWENILSSKNSVYNKLLSRVSGEISESERSFWDEVWEYASEEENTDARFTRKASADDDFSLFEELDAEHTDIISQIKSYKEGRTHIAPETAAALYGSKPFSASALQKYNVCPFSYFARYGLKLKEEQERKVRGNDLGTMIHWAVCEYCRKVQENAQTPEEKRECWLKLDKERSDGIIAELTNDIAEKSIKANPDFNGERLRLMCSKAAKTISRAAQTIRESLVAGGFSACEFEKDFLFSMSYKNEDIQIQGTIDRLDTAQYESGTMLRIIDYKTGVDKFSVADIYNKTNLQLVIYALAAQDMYKEDGALVSAMMYSKVRDELVKTELGSPAAVVRAPLDGVIVCSSDNAGGDELSLHDCALAQPSAKSSYIAVQTKKDGTVNKRGSAVISRAKFDVLSRYVTKTAVETKKAIRCGSIAAYPAGNGETAPCRYCDYSAVCLYNEERDGYRKQMTNNAKAWEKLETEDSYE